MLLGAFFTPYSHLKFKTITVSVATCFDQSGHPQGIKFYKNIKELHLHWLLSFD